MLKIQQNRNLQAGMGWLMALMLFLGIVVMVPANHSVIFSFLVIPLLMAIIFGGYVWAASASFKDGLLFAFAAIVAFIQGVLWSLFVPVMILLFLCLIRIMF